MTRKSKKKSPSPLIPLPKGRGKASVTSRERVKPHILIDIARQAGVWPACRPLITDAILKTLKIAKHKKPCEISVLLTDDKEIQILNRNYRGKNKPTNVLSFRQDDDYVLGDIVLSLGTLKKECREQKKPIKNHIAHMTVHGLLHLLGHDHENDKDAAIMEKLEIKILASLGIPDPYANVRE